MTFSKLDKRRTYELEFKDNTLMKMQKALDLKDNVDRKKEKGKKEKGDSLTMKIVLEMLSRDYKRQSNER